MAVKAGRRPAPSWRSRNVIVLGVVSLLTDAGSEMVMPLLPAFVTGLLGGGALALGAIEGAAEATASALRWVSGRWSDRSGRRRPLVVGGYTLSSGVRPLVALAAAPWHVLAVRVADRIGKGLRGAPRDALIAASVVPEERGRAFGLHRAMDHAGAVLGPAIATLLLLAVTTDLRTIFWLSAVPGLLVVLAVAFGVREVEGPAAADGAPSLAERPAPGETRRILGTLAPIGLVRLGQASDLFLLLLAGGARVPLAGLPILWMAIHVVKALTSLVGGPLADAWGRRKTIALGWLVFAAAFAGLAFAESRAVVIGLVLFHGAHQGLAEGAEKALVADVAPAARRGTFFGWYHLVTGLLALAASLLFGALWEAYGPRAAFLTGAAIALAAVVALGATGRPQASAPARIRMR